MKIKTSVRVPKAQKEAIKNIAKEKGVSVNGYLQKLVNELLDGIIGQISIDNVKTLEYLDLRAKDNTDILLLNFDMSSLAKVKKALFLKGLDLSKYIKLIIHKETGVI